jgi:GNAT superfamily N-acetyltransferase
VNLLVRPMAAGDDVALLGRIVRDAYLGIPDYPPDPEYDDALDKVAERAAHGRIVVAELEGRLVGCLTFVDDPNSELYEWHDPRFTCIRMFGVAGSVQGRGVGAAMLQWCIDETRRLGRAGIGLHSITEMKNAQHMYLRFGFVRRPEFDFVVPDTIGLAFEYALVA